MNVKSLVHAATVAALAAAAFGAHATQADEYTLNLNVPAPVAAGAPRIVERVAQVDEYQRYQLPAAHGVDLLPRAQVSAEARAARRLGLIPEGEGAAPVASAQQLEQIRQAGLAAVQHHVASN